MINIKLSQAPFLFALSLIFGVSSVFAGNSTIPAISFLLFDSGDSASPIYKTRIEIPTGSIDKNVEFTIFHNDTDYIDDPKIEAQGPFVDIAVSGQNEFDEFLRITIPFACTDPSISEAIRIYFTNEYGELERLSGGHIVAIDCNGGTLTFIVDSLPDHEVPPQNLMTYNPEPLFKTALNIPQPM